MCCRIQQFLCGCTLRHGAITASVLSALSALGSIIIGIVIFIARQTILQALEQWKRQSDRQDYGGVNRDQMNLFLENVNLYITILGAIFLTIGLIWALITLCLGLAICLNNSCLVIFWLVWSMIDIVFSGIFVTLFMIGGYYHALVAVARISFNIYLWVVLYNFHMELKEGRRPMYVSAPMKA